MPMYRVSWEMPPSIFVATIEEQRGQDVWPKIPPAIQCECQHGPNMTCPNTARLFVTYHCMCRCQRPEFQPDGENSEFLCWPCFHSLVTLIVGNILRMLTHGHPPECTACHKPTPSPNEVIRKVEPL